MTYPNSSQVSAGQPMRFLHTERSLGAFTRHASGRSDLIKKESNDIPQFIPVFSGQPTSASHYNNLRLDSLLWRQVQPQAVRLPVSLFTMRSESLPSATLPPIVSGLFFLPFILH